MGELCSTKLLLNTVLLPLLLPSPLISSGDELLEHSPLTGVLPGVHEDPLGVLLGVGEDLISWNGDWIGDENVARLFGDTCIHSTGELYARKLTSVPDDGDDPTAIGLGEDRIGDDEDLRLPGRFMESSRI